MLKFLVIIVCLITFIMGLLGIIGLSLAYFLPSKEKFIEIKIEVNSEGEVEKP